MNMTLRNRRLVVNFESIIKSLVLTANVVNHSASTALYFPQGYSERLYAIHNSRVTNDLRDTTLYNFLVIPSEVNYVNFTWKSGRRKYFYDFDRLQTMDESILKAPTLSIRKSGRIPQEQKSK